MKASYTTGRVFSTESVAAREHGDLGRMAGRTYATLVCDTGWVPGGDSNLNVTVKRQETLNYNCVENDGLRGLMTASGQACPKALERVRPVG